MLWGTPMFGKVTAFVGWIYIGEIQVPKHAAHMLQACVLGSSQVMSPIEKGERGFSCREFPSGGAGVVEREGTGVPRS